MSGYDDLDESDQSALDEHISRYESELQAGKTPDIDSFLSEIPKGLRSSLLDQLLRIGQKHSKDREQTQADSDPAAGNSEAFSLQQEQSSTDGSPKIDQIVRPRYDSDSGFTRPIVLSVGSRSKDSRTDQTSDTDGLGIEIEEETRAAATFQPQQDADGTIASTSDGAAEHRPLQYRVESEIGRGGMGVVFKVRDDRLNRTLAMKVIRGQELTRDSTTGPSSRGIARFVREAEITGRLDHPGVVPVHELASDSEGRMYFTMKYVQGLTLHRVFRQYLKGDPDWSLARVIDVLIRVCETLAFAHSKHVIHRDLKPSNIMVGEFGEAYVMDWGLAKVINQPDQDDDFVGGDHHSGSGSSIQTMYGYAVGTPHYMPPEQAAGKLDQLDGQSDVYSTGAMLYEMVVGQRPYFDTQRSTGQDVVAQVLAGPPTPIADLEHQGPPELVAITAKAMSRDKKDRYATMSDLAEDLRALVGRRVVSAYKTGTFTKIKKWVARNQGLTIASLLAMMALAIGLSGVSILQYRNQIETQRSSQTISDKNDELEITNDQLLSTVNRERQAREQLAGQSLIAHATDAREAGDINLAARLSIEAINRYPSPESLDSIYSGADRFISQRSSPLPGVARKLVWSPDGSRILAIGADAAEGSALILDADSGAHATKLINRKRKPLLDACWISAGQQVCLAGGNGTLSWYDARTGIRRFALGLGIQYESSPGNYERPDVTQVLPCMNGQWLAAATKATPDHPGQIHLVDIQTGAMRGLLVAETFPTPESEQFTVVRCSPDGQQIVAGCEDGRFHIWDLRTKNHVAIQAAQEIPVHDIQFDASGKRFLTIAVDRQVPRQPQPPDDNGLLTPTAKSLVAFWDAESGERIQRIPFAESLATCATFYSTELALVGMDTGSLRLYDIVHGTLLDQTPSNQKSSRSILIAKHDDLAFHQTGEKSVTVWHVAKTAGKYGLANFSIIQGTPDIKHESLRADGRALAFCSDGRLQFRNLAKDCLAPLLAVLPNIYHLRCSPDKTRLAIPCSNLSHGRLFDANVSQLIATLDYGGEFHSQNFSEDGRWFFTSTKSGLCRLWDARDGALIQQFDGDAPSFEFMLDERYLLARGLHEIQVWDRATSTLAKSWKEDDASEYRLGPEFPLITQIEFTNDHPKIFNAITGELIEAEFGRSCNLGTWSKSGRYFWCHGESEHVQHPHSQQLQLFDRQVGKTRFQAQSDRVVLNASYAEDESTMLIQFAATNSTSSTVRIVSLPDGDVVREFDTTGSTIGWSANFERVVVNSPRGSFLYDGHAGTKICRFASKVQLATFSREGSFIALQMSRTKSDGRTGRIVRLVDADDGQFIVDLPGDQTVYFGFAFAPDGSGLFTRDGSGLLRRWPTDIIPVANRCVQRQLSPLERRKYMLPDEPNTSDTQQQDQDELWRELRNSVALITPVSHERQSDAWRLIDQTAEQLRTMQTDQNETVDLRVREALDVLSGLVSGLHETDPVVLIKLALFESRLARRERANLKKAIIYLEHAVQHARCPDTAGLLDVEIQVVDELNELRQSIAPEVASFASADALMSSSTEQQQEALTWGKQNAPEIVAYVEALKAFHQQDDLAAVAALRSCIELLSSESSLGSEPYELLADRYLSLGKSKDTLSAIAIGLNGKAYDSKKLWKQWLQIAFRDPDADPILLRDQLPAVHPSTAPEPRPRQWADWLLTQLANGAPLRINCGGYDYVATTGEYWAEDRFYNFGFAYFGDQGDSQLFGQAISGSEDWRLYQSERWFPNKDSQVPAGYQIPLPKGTYEVSLGFARIYQTARVFDVVIEDTVIEKDFDHNQLEWNDDATEARTLTAICPVEDGLLNIDLNSSNNNPPQISCLKIHRVNQP